MSDIRNLVNQMVSRYMGNSAQSPLTLPAVEKYSAGDSSPYGQCPICGADGVSRERRLNGNDRCVNGHEYPSASAVTKDAYARKHKPATGQLGLFEKPSEKQKPLFSKKVDDEAGRWVTMRGARIFISGDDGRVLKGQKRLMGKTKEMIERESAGKGEGEKPPMPKGLAEMGRIKGGRKDNRQKGLFEEINPGFKWDEDEDVKSVSPKPVQGVQQEPTPSPAVNEQPKAEETDDDQPFYATLDDATRERLFSEMRKIDAQWSQQAKQSQFMNSGKGLAVGAAGFDEFHKSELMREYLSGLRKGMTPDQAFESAKTAGKNAVELHNKKRPGDFNWHRHLETNQPMLEGIHRRVVSAIAPLKPALAAAAADEPFSLSGGSGSKKAKPAIFNNTESTKQGALFDSGKGKGKDGKGDIPGQELLFNSDAGDVGNPKTMENRVSQQDDSGPQNGDRDATGLVFRDGRWHRDDEGEGDSVPPKSSPSPADIAAKARQNNESIWTAAKRELGVNSMAEIPPELRKQLADAMEKTPAVKAAPKDEPKPSAARARAMKAQEEKQSTEDSSPSPAEPNPSTTPIDDAVSAGATPRSQATHYYDSQKHDEYAWARESDVANTGEDLLGSARHKRNQWRTLEELEKQGSAIAEEMITRANLLKRNPPNFAVFAERNPATAMAMHLAMNAIPARPYTVKSNEVHADTAKKKLARKLYVEAFDSLKEKAESLAKSEDDPMKALSEFADHAMQIMGTYKADQGNYVREQLNHMITVHNKTQTKLRNGGYLDINSKPGFRSKASDVSTQVRRFAELARENYGPEWMEHDDIQEKAIDVISGQGVEKVFGIKKEGSGKAGQYRFNPSEAYIEGISRKGGIPVDTSTVKKSQDVMMDALAFRGLQYGNSMTDEEREHHTKRAAEAMVDLADVLGLPDKAIGLNGKLGLAFGARGRAGAKAHFEPSNNVINLTRKSGAGSLAHEWAHFFDYNTSESETGGQATKSMQGNFRKLKEAWSAAKDRIRDEVSNAYRKMSSKARWEQISYWTSDEEMFARFTERMIQRKLNQSGRDNSYLVGLTKSTHKFWPNDDEIDKAIPHLDAIFSDFAKKFEAEHGKEPRKDRYVRIQAMVNDMNAIADRYLRQANVDGVIQVPVDKYAHPLVHAAVGGLGHMAVQSLVKNSTLRKLAHAAVASAMAAWMASANAGQTGQGQGPSSSPAVNQPSVSAPASSFARQQSGNRSIDAIVNQAFQNHQQAVADAKAEKGIPADPGQAVPHSVSNTTGARAPGVKPLKGEDEPKSANPSTSPAGKGEGFTDSQHPRHPAGAPESKGGEFAPKGGVESGSESGSESPRNYPDNLNKPADQQTNYSPPERSIEGVAGGDSGNDEPKSLEQKIAEHRMKLASQKSAPEPKASRRDDPDTSWKRAMSFGTERVQASKDAKSQERKAKKQQEQQAKQQEQAVSFDPDQLEREAESSMADADSDASAFDSKPKSEDFKREKDYQRALKSWKREKGASKANITKKIAKSVVPEIATEYELDHAELESAVNDAIAMESEGHKRQEEARKYVTDRGYNAGRINRNEDAGKDHSSTSLDEFASEWAGLYPEIAGSDESQWVDRMWNLAKAGKQDAPSSGDENFVRKVAERLHGQKMAGGGSSPFPADSDPNSEPDPGPIRGQVGDVDFTPFHRKSLAKELGLLVDKYLREHLVT